MATKLTVGLDASSLAAATAAELVKGKVEVELAYGTKTVIAVGSAKLPGGFVAARYLLRLAAPAFVGASDFETAEVDSWCDVVSTKFARKGAPDAAVLAKLERHLQHRVYFVGTTATLADAAVFAGLNYAAGAEAFAADQYPNLARWFATCEKEPAFTTARSYWSANPSSTKSSSTSATGAKTQGTFVQLEGAKEGEVVTRFPPEASGFLHIGHAKAAMLNQYFAQKYKGKLIMRFDDTNPAKESSEFEKVILEDLQLLDVKPDIFTHTSDHFDSLLTYCETLIKAGKAFVDDTPADTMASQRRALEPSKNRDLPVDKSLALWKEMQAGSDIGVKCCVRAKINYADSNGCLRDPVLYRCKPEPHVRTGDKYKVYPTYDFACPIVDSVEGVTHALRTTEYHDRDVQYRWVCEALGLRVPKVWDFSRLNLQYTVMSKRQLTWFVNDKRVDGWSDPRFPTVRGILRHGLTVQGLRQFILDMGSSKSSVLMEWDKIWATNKKVIDPAAPRHTALAAASLVTVTVDGISSPELVDFDLHPKDPSIGQKKILRTPTILLEQEDADVLKEGSTVTLMEWGNAKVASVTHDGGKVAGATLKLDTDNKDFRGTLKLTWLPVADDAKNVDVLAVSFAPLITKPIVAKGEDLASAARDVSRFEDKLKGTASLATLQAGDIIQISRKGFFIVDKAAMPALDQPLVVFSIPDGHQKTLASNLHAPVAKTVAKTVDASKVKELEAQVRSQTGIVREMRKGKTDKEDIKKAEGKLKELQAALKAAQAGSSAAAAPAAAKSAPAGSAAVNPEAEAALVASITKYGDEVRTVKAAKGDFKPILEKLLAAKAEYKTLTGKDFKPQQQASRKSEPKKEKKKEAAKPQEAAAVELTPEEQAFMEKIKAQGNVVRDLKAAGNKEESAKAVEALLALKDEFATKFGKEVAGTKSKPKKSKGGAKPQQKQQKGKSADADASKHETKLGMQAKKLEDFPEWYHEAITKSEMIEYFDISGCYVLRPWAYAIWESIKSFLDTRIKSIGVENCYFPCFVSQAALEREKEHIEDFAPEVAWVTRSGDKDLDVPIAIRPTSETVMYPSYAKWVQSHRDLPLKLNQWCNVVRWEFKQPTPFLRTREFLWQEGHTAHATKEESVEEVYQILEYYAAVYEELLAIPVVRGKKTEKEKFAGGDFTTTVEGFIPATGRGIQGATSHSLGQNFAKMFNIQYEDPEQAGQKLYVWQNSWGLTTRTIGVLIMVHGDDKGLVLPPRVAPTQVVLVPTGLSNKSIKIEDLVAKCDELAEMLRAKGVRVKVDARPNYSPPWKYNYWELKGVPLRLEVGPKDIEKKTVKAVRRDNAEKSFPAMAELGDIVPAMLEQIQADLYAKATKERNEHLKTVDKWEDFNDTLDGKNLLLVPFCGAKSCEATIKQESTRVVAEDATAPAMGAKSLCTPLEQEPVPAGTKCVCPGCDVVVESRTMFGRSY
eukprot:m.484725 g.484725  ORF g.484725 m.484725 type:complete len:1461 (+) comp23523_c0_seq1:124-4506(+)